MQIRPYDNQQREAVIRLALRAWGPVFDSLEQVMSAEVYRELVPDWQASQRKAVGEACDDQEIRVWVAQEGGSLAGFVAVKLHQQSNMGEIYMIAVDPDFQRRSIGSALTDFAECFIPFL